MNLDWAATFAAFGSALSVMVLLVGVFTSVAALTRTERLVRRLKAHSEILASLSASPGRSKMQEIVDSEVVQLHSKLLPDPAETNKRFERAEGVGGLLGLAVFGVGLILEFATDLPGIKVAGWLVIPILAFLAYAAGRQQKAQATLAARAGPPRAPQERQRGRKGKR